MKIKWTNKVQKVNTGEHRTTWKGFSLLVLLSVYILLYLHRQRKMYFKSQPTCCELSLHLLKDGVLSCGLGPAGERLGGSAGEHGGHVGNVLQANAKGADQLLDKVECVWCDLGIRDGPALFKGHWIALGQALLELPQNLWSTETELY